MTDGRKSLGLVELHAAVVLFALAGLFGKWLGTISPMMIVLGRTTFATLALLPVLFAHRTSVRPHLRPAAAGTVLSGLVLAFHWVSFFHAIQVSSVAVGLLTFSSFPLFVTLMEPIFFRERLRGVDLLTAAVVLIGLACIIPRWDPKDPVTLGAIWGTASGLSFAVLALLNRRLVARHPSTLVAAGQDGTAALALLACLPAYAHPVTPRDVLLMAILGVVCTALAHTLFIKSLAHVRAQLASVTAGLESLYGIVLAFLLQHERPAPRTLIGGALIVLAVTIGTLLRHSPKASSPNPGALPALPAE
jgi:drug/metabolite transporter (DMT)-like permease